MASASIERRGLEANGNDEYVLEAALKLTEAHGGEVTLLTMGPAGATEALRKGLAMGATRAVHVVDDALVGSCARATRRGPGGDPADAVLRPRLRRRRHLRWPGRRRWRPRSPPASACRTSRTPATSSRPADGAGVRIHRLSPTGHDVLEAPMPALVMGTQVLGEPRYPSLRGIMAARSKEVVARSLADVGVDAGARRRGRGHDPRHRRLATAAPRRRHRPAHRSRRGGRRDHRLPGRAGARLMAGPTILALAELSDGAPTRLSLELATLAAELADGRRWPRRRGLHRPWRGRGGAAEVAALRARMCVAVEAETAGTTPAAAVLAAHLAGRCSTGRRPTSCSSRPLRTARTWPASSPLALDLPILVNAAGGELVGRRPGRRDEHLRWPPHHAQRLHRRAAASSSSGPAR